MELNNHFNENTAVYIKYFDEEQPVAAHNNGVSFVSASVIKTFILAYYIHKNEKLDRIFEIPKKSMIGNSVITELKITSASLEELLTYMICSSDNTATNMLLADAGYEQLNSFCRDFLYTEQTVIARKMLDFKAASEGRENKTSLNDVYKCMKFLMQSETAKTILSRQKCTERIGRYIYGAKMYAKSGDLDFVYNDVAVFEKDNRYVFCGVLTNNYDKSQAKRLCGLAGLYAFNSTKPII